MGKRRVRGLDSELPLSLIGSFRVVAVADVDISTLNNGDTKDGVVLATGDGIVLLGQADKTENGPYTIGASEEETDRHSSFPSGSDSLFPGALVHIQEGVSYANSLWFVGTPGDIVLDTTAVEFVRVPGIDGSGRKKSAGHSDGDGADQVILIASVPRETRKREAPTLTAPGDSIENHVEDFSGHTFTIVVAAIQTDINVGIKATGNGTDYGFLSLAGDPANAVTGMTIDKEKATIIANGTYHLRVRGDFEKMKLVFIDEDPSPSTATVTSTYRGGD